MEMIKMKKIPVFPKIEILGERDEVLTWKVFEEKRIKKPIPKETAGLATIIINHVMESVKDLKSL